MEGAGQQLKVWDCSERGPAPRRSKRQTGKLPKTADPRPERPHYGSLEALAEGFWIEHMGAMIPNLWWKHCCGSGGENALLPQTQFPLKY